VLPLSCPGPRDNVVLGEELVLEALQVRGNGEAYRLNLS